MLTKGLFSSNTDNWATPQKLFDELDKTFHFTLDVCADELNHKCDRFFTKDDDGLKQDWGGALFGATHLTDERLANGFRNAQSIKEWQLCQCQLEPTRNGGKIISIATLMPK